MIVVREAALSDAEALGRVHVEAWRAAYRGMMPDDFLASLDPAVRAARWHERLSATVAGRKTFVAINAGAVVGFASIGPARTPGDGELYAINLAPAVWGTGASSALLARAIEALRDFGHREAILWVLRQNARARRFYEREGWKPIGANAPDQVAGERRDTISENDFTFDVDELRYGRAL